MKICHISNAPSHRIKHFLRKTPSGASCRMQAHRNPQLKGRAPRLSMPPPTEDPETPGDGGHTRPDTGQELRRPRICALLRRRARPGAGPVTRLRAALPAGSAPASPNLPHPCGAPADLHRVNPADVHVAVGDHEGAQLAAGPRQEGEQREQRQERDTQGSHGCCGSPAALPRPAAPPPRPELNK